MSFDREPRDRRAREYVRSRMKHEPPPDLVDSIMREVDRTPQRRGALGWPLVAAGLAVAGGLLAVAVWNAAPSGPVGGEPTPSPTAERSTPRSETQAPAASASAEPSALPSEPDPTPLPAPPAGLHAMTPEDAFEVPDECANPEAGYRIWMPDDWWYNTAFDDFDACQWFALTTFDVTDGQTVPDEISVVLRTSDGGDFGLSGEVLSRGDYTVAGQPAVRFEFLGVGGGFMPIGSRSVVWIVGIGGELPSETTTTPWLLASTSTEVPGNYEENVDVLDRMIATLEINEP
jgi:hypothetical protein